MSLLSRPQYSLPLVLRLHPPPRASLQPDLSREIILLEVLQIYGVWYESCSFHSGIVVIVRP
jgi:hypothetical protein